MKSTVRRIFPGWWVVLGAFGIQALQGSLLANTFGTYVPFLQNEFGWSKTTLAGAYSLQQVESGLLGPFQGWLTDRFGPRVVIRIGLVLSAIGFVLFSRLDSLPLFYASFLLISLGFSLSGYLTISSTLMNWFIRRRATASAFSSAGMNASGLVVPLVALAIVSLGWREVAFASAFLVLAIGLPLSQLLRQSPEQYGLVPDGEVAGSDSTKRPAISADDFTLSEAMRTPSFWYLSVGHGMAATLYTAISVHLVSAVTQLLGAPIETGAAAVALMTGTAVLVQIPGGLIGDRFDKRLIATACLFIQMIGMLLLANATAWWMVVAFALCQGTAVGVRGPLMVALRADYFGRGSIAKIMGVSSLIVSAGTLSGPLIVGIIADSTGSYQIGFTILAALSTIGGLAFFLARKPERHGRVKRET